MSKALSMCPQTLEKNKKAVRIFRTPTMSNYPFTILIRAKPCDLAILIRECRLGYNVIT